MRISHEAISPRPFIERRGALERELIAALRTGRPRTNNGPASGGYGAVAMNATLTVSLHALPEQRRRTLGQIPAEVFAEELRLHETGGVATTG